MLQGSFLVAKISFLKAEKVTSEVVLPLKWLCQFTACLEASDQNLQTSADHFAASDSCEGIIEE